MSTVIGFNPLSSLLSLELGSRLTQLVAPITEIYPFGPKPPGTQQQLRIALPNRFAVDLWIYDRPQITRDYEGGVIRINASPNAAKALMWIQSRAVKPSVRSGVLVSRPPATIEIFNVKQARQIGLTEYGFTLPLPPALPERPSIPAQPFVKPAASATPIAPTPAVGSSSNPPIDALAKQYADCLRSARAVLGEEASSEDVHASAKAVFERLVR
jgi:hypothetical protein